MIQVRDDDGQWRDMPRALSFTVHMGDGTTRFVRNRVLPVARDDSDDVTVTLADDATWEHMRGLYPRPEWFEGV